MASFSKFSFVKEPSTECVLNSVKTSDAASLSTRKETETFSPVRRTISASRVTALCAAAACVSCLRAARPVFSRFSRFLHATCDTRHAERRISDEHGTGAGAEGVINTLSWGEISGSPPRIRTPPASPPSRAGSPSCAFGSPLSGFWSHPPLQDQIRRASSTEADRVTPPPRPCGGLCHRPGDPPPTSTMWWPPPQAG